MKVFDGLFNLFSDIQLSESKYMKTIHDTLANYKNGAIDKPAFIKNMYEDHHVNFFDYANYLAQTNIRNIQVEDGRVIMTSRDRGIRIACTPGDFRIAPIEILNFFDYEKSRGGSMGAYKKI